MTDSRLVLFAHGSSDPTWLGTFHRLVRGLAAQVGERRVGLAFMERARPTLGDAVARADADGVRCVRVLPMFFSAGGHVSRDIPRLVDEARSRFPRTRIELLQAVGEHPVFAEALGEIVRSALDGGDQE